MLRISNPQGLNRLGHFLTADCKSAGTPSGGRYLIVAVCSAIVTFLTSSCTAGLVIGKNQRQQQENNISTRADSSHFVPTITIR
ncbi:hypothetical protein ACTQ3T_11405 [Segatella copri]|uniref:hypothetical protein n=1 Tax=Segatella copri TaxID=165179 RepID=UPI0026186274